MAIHGNNPRGWEIRENPWLTIALYLWIVSAMGKFDYASHDDLGSWAPISSKRGMWRVGKLGQRIMNETLAAAGFPASCYEVYPLKPTSLYA